MAWATKVRRRKTSSRLRLPARSSPSATSWSASQAAVGDPGRGRLAGDDVAAGARLGDGASTAASAAGRGRPGGELSSPAVAVGELVGRAERDQAAPVDDRDPVGELLGLVEQVGGEHHRHALGPQLAHVLPGRAARGRVEPAVGSSRNSDLGAADERERERQPLLLPAGEVPEPGPRASSSPTRSSSSSGSSGSGGRRRTAAAPRRAGIG
jgi:hypothetical protein